MRRAEEVRRAQHLDDVRDGVLGQQHAAEHAHLGDEVLRGGPVELPTAAAHRGEGVGGHEAASRGWQSGHGAQTLF